VKILDFGLARTEAPLSGQAEGPETKSYTPGSTEPGRVMGTAGYMSPEQVRGQPADARSDVFSFGCVLYEMVSGDRLFGRDTAADTIAAILREEPPDFAEAGRSAPPEVRRVIRHCLEKDPEERFQSARDLASDLRAIYSAGPRDWPGEVATAPLAGQVMLDAIEKGEAREERRIEERWENSIAVLPFADLSPEKDQEYFCDGIAEELINVFTRVEDLRVVARTSAFFFKAKNVDVREIGSKLNVDRVLEGSVRKAGNKLRITAQLINVADGYHLWSDRYDRDLDDAFAIQDEISVAIVEALKGKFFGTDREPVKRPTENMEAYDLYLQGLHLQNRVHPEELQKGLECFVEATEKDPNFALAYVGLGSTYAKFAFLGLLSPDETYPKAKAALNRALEIDSTLGEAHALLANIFTLADWNWKAAEDGFKKAISLKPGFDEAHAGHANYLLLQRRFDEALSEIGLAQELNPLKPDAFASAIAIYYCAGRFEEAERQIHKALEVDPYFPLTHFFSSWVFLRKGEYQQHLDALKNAHRLSGGTLPWAECALGVAYYLLGQKDKADEVLHKLLEGKEEGYVPCCSLANNYLARGDMDKALEWLEKAYEFHDFLMPFLNVLPDWEPLRSQPRGQAILKKMNMGT
jgi:serine/threonine-protein kinase